jgi:ABC-2 type transport system ATP-binding protein
MADRIGIIRNGEIVLVGEKAALMHQLGKKQLILNLRHRLERLPEGIAGERLELTSDGTELAYTFDARADETGIADLLRQLGERGIDFKDLRTNESSLEDIFVNVVRSSP